MVDEILVRRKENISQQEIRQGLDDAEFQGFQTATVVEVQRVLEVGRLLLSVLTEEEVEELRYLIGYADLPPEIHQHSMEIGNTGVT